MKRKADVQLRNVAARARGGDLPREFPFSVPSIASLDTLDFDSAVTFFVGENGSGKSTLLEGIAAAAALPTVGSIEINRDATLKDQQRLTKHLKLVWNKRNHRGFFLRAEDFFGFAKTVAQLRVDMHQRIEDIETEFEGASDYSKGLAGGPARASLAQMTSLYGPNLDARSHGESFLKLFQSRLVPNGVYLLDEPEAALSPQSQLALLSMIAASVQDGSQFIIATHAPILLAYPNARIYSFDQTPVQAVAFEDLDHVTLTRSFLNDPARYLRHLFDEPTA